MRSRNRLFREYFTAPAIVKFSRAKDTFKSVLPPIFPPTLARFYLFKVSWLRSVTPDTIAMKLFNGRLAARCKQYSEIRIAICWTKGHLAASGCLDGALLLPRHPGSQLTIDHERTASFWSSLAVLPSASRWCVTAIVYQVCGTFSINPSSFDDRAVAKGRLYDTQARFRVRVCRQRECPIGYLLFSGRYILR